MRTANISHIPASVLFSALAVTGTSAAGQSAQVPIRQVSAPTATMAEPWRSFSEIREVANGKVLVHSSGDRRLALFDAKLSNPVAVADTMGGTAAPYPRFAKLVSYSGDSTLFADAETRAFVVIDAAGKMGSVMAAPKAQDFNGVTSGGPVGYDAHAGLIYQSQRPFAIPRGCQATGAAVPPRPPLSDSVAIMRGDFETRKVDTIGHARVAVAGFVSPVATFDANCHAVAATVRINPAVPPADAWTVTSTGVVAIVRGHDYHVDFIDRGGAVRSGPKLPFDWKRITDADKQARIDSARHVVDSLTAAGGYRLQLCNGGRSTSFNANPPANSGGAGAPAGRGGGGGGGGVSVFAGTAGGAVGGDGAPLNNDCQTLTVAAQFVPLGEMADYIPPIRENAAKPDRDGNIWILPSTSASAKGGLLYDVVNAKGELAERVQLPADRDIAGFGRNGVLFLSHRVGDAGSVLERVSVLRK